MQFKHVLRKMNNKKKLKNKIILRSLINLLLLMGTANKHLLFVKKKKLNQPVDSPLVCTPLNQENIFGSIYYHKRKEPRMR